MLKIPNSKRKTSFIYIIIILLHRFLLLSQTFYRWLKQERNASQYGFNNAQKKNKIAEKY